MGTWCSSSSIYQAPSTQRARENSSPIRASQITCCTSATTTVGIPRPPQFAYASRCKRAGAVRFTTRISKSRIFAMPDIALKLNKYGNLSPVTVTVENRILAGGTGRDQAAVDHHIRELGALGVPPPRTTPMFYRVSASLLTSAGHIQVTGRDSTGA